MHEITRSKVLRRLLTSSLVLGIALTAASPAPAEETLTFCVYTSDKPTAMFAQFRPVLERLEVNLGNAGRDVGLNLKVHPNYSRAIEALTRGDCDLARFGPASYVLVKEREPGIELLGMEHKKGQRQFFGVFIVAEGSDIRNLEHLRGRSFAFGNEFSTIGRFLSQAALVEAGLLAKDLGERSFLGRHDKVALAVANGRYEAGAVKESTFQKYAESHGLREIARFPNVTKPWLARSGLDAGLVSALRDALLALNDESALASLKQDGFLPARDEDYRLVREGMALAERFEAPR